MITMGKKRNYPGNRRSPIAHKVDSHRRDGHSVDGYERGSGSKVSSDQVIPLSGRKSNAEAFIVTLKYEDKTSEKINVFAPRGAYKKALDEALEERTHQEMPMEINILDPSLGEVISFIGKGIGTGLKYVKSGIVKATPHIKKGLKKAGRGIGRGAKAVGKGIGRRAVTYAQRKEAERLVNRSYSENLSRRAIARTKLKTKYPEIYDNCDFSTREMSRIRREREKQKKAREKSYKEQRKKIKKFFS